MGDFDDRLYNTPEAAEYCRRGQSTLEKLRLVGDGPVFVKAGRSVRYKKSDLDAWINEHRRRSTSEYSTLPQVAAST